MKALFNYPGYRTSSAFLQYKAHSGQVVEVVRPLREGEETDYSIPMYLVRADDGWEGHVFDDELSFIEEK